MNKEIIMEHINGNKKVIYLTKKVDKAFLMELYSIGLNLNDVGIYERKFREYKPFTICPYSLLKEIDLSVFDVLVPDESISKRVLSKHMFLVELKKE